MTQDETIPKLYFSMDEVKQMLGVNASCIRYWLKEFKIDESVHRPSFGHKNFRRFVARDINRLREIKRLLKDEGYTLHGAKKKFLEFKPSEKLQ